MCIPLVVEIEMDEDQELRYVCKLCNKKHPCGKSLGGHMRSHVVANSAECEEKVEPNMKNLSSLGQESTLNEPKVVEFGNGQSSYVLRENPRKTWRAVDSTFPLPQEKICKQCGKVFQSLKALCGHMASHSERDKGFKDDSSWTSDSLKLVMDSHSDTEAEDRVLRTRSLKSKRYKKVLVKSPSFTLANNGSSSVSEIDGDEQEEVAICLMLLSRDSYKGGVNSVVESSDNNSVILETKSSSIDMRIGKRELVKNVHNQEEIVVPKMNKTEDVKLKESVLDAEFAQVENSDSGYFLDECAKAESDVSVHGFRRNGGFSEYNKPLSNEYGAEFRQSLNRSKSYRPEVNKDFSKENEYDNGRIESRKRKYNSENPESFNDPPNVEVCNSSQKKSKYECFNCKKSFKSYQALGGHRPCHKRSNAYYESRYESRENSPDESAEFVTAGKKKSSAKNSSPDKKIKAKKHICPFCNRVFKNGQALGGHKRSHFIGGHDENNNQSPVKKPDMLDLNLPAPEQDEDYANDW